MTNNMFGCKGVSLKTDFRRLMEFEKNHRDDGEKVWWINAYQFPKAEVYILHCDNCKISHRVWTSHPDASSEFISLVMGSMENKIPPF